MAVSDNEDKVLQRLFAAEMPKLFRIPGVNGVVLGIKSVKGQYVEQDKPAVIVYVTKKIPLDQVPQNNRVPALLTDSRTGFHVKTDVVERASMRHKPTASPLPVNKPAKPGSPTPAKDDSMLDLGSSPVVLKKPVQKPADDDDDLSAFDV